jgi:hypothetical protein
MSNEKTVQQVFEKNGGVLRLIPNFVPRRFGKAGRRLRLHPDDYFALGTARGAIKERWFSSVIAAMNGPLAPEDEGLSYVALAENDANKISLRRAIEILGAEIIGEDLYKEYGMWPMYSKFFDYATPLFHHLHLDDAAAGKVGMIGKPESYYFPPQLNNYRGEFDATYFGYDPDVTREQVKERLLHYEEGDTRITELSRAYRIELGTGWYTPPGVVHAPGSILTYEPQWNSDVNSVHENVTSGEVYPYEFLVENVPDDKKRNIEYVLDLMDWEKNVDPHYKKHYFRPPVTSPKSDTVHTEKWVSYANDYIAAKEVTVNPGESIVLKDEAAYGCIIIEGHGTFGSYDAEAAICLRFGQMSADEYFVSEQAARQGLQIVNESRCEPMVILQHFGPNNPEVPMKVPQQ